ncbi:MAG: MBL fold metallo-hydrolase [Gemmatimonadaceae bacterium]
MRHLSAVAVLALVTVSCTRGGDPGADSSATSNSSVPGVRAETVSSRGTRVVMLGTGMPRPDPEASGPATAIVYGDRVFLIDAGPGIERRLAAAGLPVNGVTALFVTHLHSDHTLGYPDLIFTSWVMGRKTPLHAYGPPGLAAMTDHIVAAWSEDIRIRTEGLERNTPGGYRVTAHEIGAGVVYDSGGIRVTAIPVEHGSWKESYAYRVDAPDRSVVVSGDARPSESLVTGAAGVDVLVHEVYPEPRRRGPGADQGSRYMREFHTSDRELGALAARVKPKLLVLSHIVRMGATDAELLEGVKNGGFTGRAVVAHDLESY